MATVDELVDKLKIVMIARKFDTYTNDYLKIEVEQAIAEINRCRRFTPTEDKLYDEKYEYLIIPMCIASLAKIGAEGESSHSENGITRYYTSGDNYPKQLISQIVPLIR